MKGRVWAGPEAVNALAGLRIRGYLSGRREPRPLKRRRMMDEPIDKVDGTSPVAQQNTDDEPREDGTPKPEERARFVVLRLAQFIREGRTLAEGMPFRQWQQMAEVEITNAVIDAENSRQKDDVVTKRFLFTIAASLVTIGFWGTAFAFDRAGAAAVGLICGAAGFALFAVAGEWRLRKFMRRRKARKLTASLRRVENLMRRIRAMERALDKRHKAVSKELREELKQDYRAARKKLLKGVRGSQAEAPEEPAPHSLESFGPKK